MSPIANRMLHTETTLGAEVHLAARAGKILRNNDMGAWTKAAPDLYPHQWSWDSAFIAIGLSRLDTRRAARELLTLFEHQWKNGKVPHIVFNPEAPPESYFPGAAHSPPYTSCLCQPPVHAIAALRILESAADEGERAEASAFLREIYPKLFGWHRYLATARDPEGSGLVTIYHPWESGTDNSPRWDEAMATVEVGDLSPYPRRDLGHVDDPAERPTDADYDRYLWLVKLIKRAACDDAAIHGGPLPCEGRPLLRHPGCRDRDPPRDSQGRWRPGLGSRAHRRVGKARSRGARCVLGR